MKQWPSLLGGIVLALGVQTFSPETPLIGVGDFFPALSFEQALTPEDRTYLGLAEADSFTLKDIQAEIILIEFLNKYCVSCQQQASVFNQLFIAIQEDSLLQTKVKMVGIGVGNTPYQLQTFREQKAIPFPLIPDYKFLAHKAIGEPRTPFTLVIRKGGEEQGLVVGIHAGLTTDNEAILKELREVLQSDRETLRAKLVESRPETIRPRKSILREEKLVRKIREGLTASGVRVLDLEKMPVKGLFRVSIQEGKQKRTLFVKEVYQPTVCDVCHDVHFWFAFDASGKIVFLGPILLPKAYNQEWEEQDLQNLRQKLIGRLLSESFGFDPQVDAITSATITSTIIFDSMDKAKEMFNKLKKEGYIKD
ncbi:MAG: redoxin domain-containing protein [candidate division KSB1 bacterium]|nr:redoxin domain-containing protein [candidate division KSB1 bacterium]